MVASALAPRAHATTGKTFKIKAVAFDAFTIFDPRSIAGAVEQAFPGRGSELSAAWKTRQFEYCWLRTLYGNYADFWQVSRDALAFACQAAKLDLSSEVSDRLMNALLELKPYPTSVAVLKALRDHGLRLAYVSNLTPTLLAALSRAAGIADLFEHSLSTDRVRAFKPDPRAYQMAENALGLRREEILFSAFGGWVRIAAHRGQGFQSNVDSDSSGTWTGVWRERGQFPG